MYKKSLAILLSVLLLVTSFVTLFSFSASADSANLVADGKFENGFSGWEVFNNSGKADAAFSVVKDGENNVLSAVPGLSMFKKVSLEAGVQYTVGFDFKFDTNAAVPATYDSFYRVGFANSVGALGNANFVGPYASGNKYYNVYVNQKNDSNNWKSHTFTYTPAADMTTCFVVGSYNGDSKANFFVDNVFLAKSSDLITVTPVAGEGGAVSSAVKTFKGDSVTVTAKASAGYLFEGWYNAAGAKLSDEASYTLIANEGIELTAKFVEGVYDPNMITNGDFAVNNLNGFEVFKNGNNASSDFTFNQNGTDYTLVGKAGHSLYKKVELKANTEYVMSFDFRFASADVPATYDSFYRAGFVTSVAALGNSIFVGPNATGNKYYSIYPNQKADPTNWKTHTFKFTPAEDMTVYAVVGSYNHDCVADFEVDNWTLYKTSDFITVTAAASVGGTATGTATVLVGKTVALTATPDEGYTFVGWYNGDIPVSTEAVYLHTATEAVTLTAKFKNTAPVSNYIVNGDFEQPFTTDTISNTSLTAVTGKWGKIYSGVARMEATETASFTSNDSAEKNGTRYITSGATKDANQFIRAFGQYVELPAGEYVLEFDAKSTIGNLFVASIKKGQNSIDISNDTIKYLDKSDDWKHYTVEFTVDAVGLYQIAFGGNIQGKGDGDFSIDNVTLEVYVEENPNYIVNGDFEQPFTTDTISNTSLTAVTGKWGKIYSGVARMEATETANFTSYDSAEKNGTRYITSGATKDANQFIRAFGQYVELTAGDYVLEFDAKSTIGNVFVASIRKGQNSIDTSKDTIKYLDKSDDWKHYAVTFTADEAGIYQIAFGGNTGGKGEGDFSIDNVKLTEYVETQDNFLVNGDFGETITTDKISDVSLAPSVGKWGKIYSGVARMEATESADFTSLDNVLLNGTRYLTSGSTKDDNQYIRTFGQYVELEAGEYVLSFIAKADANHLFSAAIATTPGPVDASKSVGVVDITASESWKLYSLKFTVPEKAVYQVGFGGNTQKRGDVNFSVDNVILCYAEDFTTVTAVTDGGGRVESPLGKVNIGDPVTVKATPENAYIFKGWFKGNELVSADAEYTFTVTESVELKAVFELDLDDGNAIIKNGKFDIGSTAGWNVVITSGGSSASVVVDETTGSAVAKTTGNGAVAFIQKVKLEADIEYLISFDFKFDDFASIPKEYDSFYRSGFLKTVNGGLGNANFVGPNPSGNLYKSIAGMITTEDKNAWNNISYTYTPTTDMETWFVIGAYNEQGESDYSIDNVSIIPKNEATSVSVASVSHGGSGKVKSSKSGVVAPGETVTITAIPSEGSVFGGWYVNSVMISDSAEYNYTATGQDVVYARFLDKNNPDTNQMLDNSDFSAGDLTGWGTNNISFATNTVEYVDEEGGYVKIGESDMLYQPIEMEPYSTYMIRITTRIPDIRKNSYGVHDLGFFRFGISEYDKPTVLQSAALEKDPYSYTSALSSQCDHEPNNRYHCAMKWGTYTYTYSNNSPDTILANVVVGAPYCKSDIHVQKFEFVKFVDGIVDFESDILYGEDFFNNVENPSFEEKLSDDNWGSKLPSGWSIKNEGKKGTNYLSVSGNSSKTYSISVPTGVTYVVAFSLRTDKAGTSSVSILDDNGEPWGDSFNLVTNKAVFQPKSNGEWQRMGAHLYIADKGSGVANINIKITAGSNVLDIDDITVVKLGYATHNTNPNIYTDNSFDYANPVWYSPTMFYKLADGTTVDGAVDDPVNGDYGENANTGDYSDRSLMVVALIIIPSALVMVLTAKRTDKNKKGGNL